MNKFSATRDAYGEILLELGEKNKDIVVLDADLSKSTKTILFAKKFPERFFNFGVAEANMIGTAAGLAASGKIPFCSTFAVFATGMAYNQIRQSICYSGMNVKIVASHAGITVGEDGATHQANEDISLMRVLPNMTVIVPCDYLETKKAVSEAVEYFGPVYIRLGREPVMPVYEKDYEFKIGKGILLKDGKDATIIACGIMVKKALEASEILLKEKIDVRVVNLHTIKPVDKEIIIESAEKTKRIVTAEEHSIIGGLGSTVSEVLSETKPTILKRIGLKDVFGESGKPKELLKKFEMDTEHIVNAVKELLKY
jgi:transketolase